MVRVRVSRIVWAGLVAGGGLVGGVPAALAQAPLGEMMQAVPDPNFEDAKATFEALPALERIAIQDALVWTGDYAAGADGTFGRRTFEAIQAWQRRARLPVDGMLNPAGSKALLTAAARTKTAVGFTIVTEPETGIRIGVPQKSLPKRSPNTIGGQRYQSADDRVTLDTRSQPGDAEALKALYERNIAIQTAGRQITYRLQRPDFFVIAGETPGGKFYSRYTQQGDAIRGFSIGYGKALAGDFDRIVVAIANSFAPFAGPAPASGVMAEQPTIRPPAQGLAPVAPSGTAARPGSAQSLTGLAIGGRRILAPASLQETCREPSIDGAPARIASTAKGFAILETAAPRRAVPLSYASGPAEGMGLVLFFASGEGGRAVASPAEFVAPGRLVAPLQDGAAGAVVLDKTGAVAGMVGSVAAGRRAVAGLVPPMAYGYSGAAELREAIGPTTEPPVPAEASRSLGGLASAVMPALVRITCGAAPAPQAAPTAPVPPAPPRRP